MRAHRGGGKKARRLQTRVLWACLAGGLFALAMLARPGLRTGLAQSGSAQAEIQQEQPVPQTTPQTSPKPDQQTEQQTGPPTDEETSPQPIQDTNRAPSNPDADHRAGIAHAQPQVLEIDEPVKPEPPPEPEVKATFSDPKQQQIADDTAALLKLASSLKAEVDKTTPDTLSVAVIRDADEIEKLAHKMRTK